MTTHDSPTVTLTAKGVRRGIVHFYPIAIFAIPFGMAFGVAALDAGMTLPQALSMSVLVFSGAAQFAALDFWSDTLALGSLALVMLALNARLVIMGAALAPWVNQLPPGKRILTLAYLSDPNFAVGQPALRDGERDVGLLLGGGLILWSGWIVGTLIGLAGGSLIGEVNRLGFDVVMPCFFAAVVAGQLRGDRSMLVPVLIASVLAVISLSWVPTGWNVIIGAVAGGLASVMRDAD